MKIPSIAARRARATVLVVTVAMLSAAQDGFAQQYDNDELRDTITGLGVAHNVAFPIALQPEPISSIAAGSTAYATNFGLKYEIGRAHV